MSYEMRREERGDKDISRASAEQANRGDYEGFDGMNYEQIRQPYKTSETGRKRTTGERKTSGPDEA